MGAAAHGASLKRRVSLSLLGGGLLLVLLGMSALNAFNLLPPYHGSPLALFVFTAITVVLFLLLLLLLLLLARNILKMYGDGRSRVLGSRLRSRMILGALLLSFAPIVFMALFSFLLMNRSLDRWFSQPVVRLRDQSLQLALQLTRYVTNNARVEAESLARSSAFSSASGAVDPVALAAEMRKHRITLEGGFAFVYRDGQPVASYQVPKPPLPTATLQSWPVNAQRSAGLPSAESDDPQLTSAGRRSWAASHGAVGSSELSADLPTIALRGAQNTDSPVLALGAENEYALGAASLSQGEIVVVALPLPAGLGRTTVSIADGAREYWAVYRERRAVRSTFLLLLTLVTTLTFFASSWLALFLSKQITQPVEALADAMDAIAEGDYRQRIAVSATEELSELIGSFNQMATDLEESRLMADSSAAQIEQANRKLRERQHELELILETIPSGVVVLDGARSVLQVNRAFLHLLTASLPARNALLAREAGEPMPEGLRLEDLLPQAILEDVLRLERRAQRMGLAGIELELPPAESISPQSSSSLASSLSVTMAVLNLGRNPEGKQRRGSILVVDDVSDTLQAQRQVAWKEVAQRVAHEIKNPLTPISLSAERILRHLNRSAERTDMQGVSGESAAIIRKCGEVILSSVQTLRLLVDQFGALAEFPAAQPRPASLNEVVEEALSLFHGRLEGITIETALAPTLPSVLIDPEAMKRAVANLIDNAAEAMNSSFHRVLHVETFLGERTGTATLTIADTGPGLSPEVRERLFLPYFSTKQRGTGLGLAITAKIIQDHHGTIRAEQAGAAGACFVIDLPLAKAHDLVLVPEDVPA